MLLIKKIINIDKLRLFCENHPKANIFQTFEMYQVYKSTKNYEPIYISVVGEKEELLGSLLAVIQKEHSGFVGKFSSRSIILGGPIIKDDNIDVLDRILFEYCRLVRNKAIYSQFRNIWEISDEEKEVYQKHGFVYENHLDIIHDLTKSIDDQLMNLHKGRRKNIRKAEKKDVQFEEITSKEELKSGINLIKETYNKVKLPMPDESLFISAYDIMKDKGYVKFFKANFNNSVIGVRFVFCYNNLIYDWFAGANNNFLDKFPNDFLPWKVMEWGHNNGFNSFDFGGAGKPNIPYGVREHKLKFGGTLVNWGRFEKVHQPFLFKVGKLGFEVYKRLTK